MMIKRVVVAIAAFGAACADAPTDVHVPESRHTAALSSQTESRRYIIVFQDDVSDVPQFVAAIAKEHADSVRFIYQYAIKGFAAVLKPGAAEALSRHPQVDFVEPDIITPSAGWPLTTRVPVGWGLSRIDQRSNSADGIYDAYSDGDGVNIYVVDGGIDITHPDFGGRAFAAYSSVSGYPAGEDCTGHGTAVASIAGGGNYGVATGATLWDVRTLGCGDPWLAERVAGVDWVVGNGISPAVMNISFGLPTWADVVLPSSLGNAVEGAINYGIVTVVAAGNDNGDACNQSPAHIPGAIVVASTNISGDRHSTSNYGPCVDLFAPGGAVYGALNGGGFGFHTGTSFAAPYATGVAAMLIQRNRGDYSVGLVEHVLKRSATYYAVSNPGFGSPNRVLYSHHTFPHVTGNSRIVEPGYYTWNVRPFGGDGSYSMRWELTWDGGSPTTVAYGTSYSLQVNDGDPSFTLVVELTTAPEVVAAAWSVEVCMGGGSQFCGT